jgi:hypothetical protein
MFYAISHILLYNSCSSYSLIYYLKLELNVSKQLDWSVPVNHIIKR